MVLDEGVGEVGVVEESTGAKGCVKVEGWRELFDEG